MKRLHLPLILGISMEAMSVEMAINVIADFPATAGGVSGWQFALIDVADLLNMIDRKIMYKEESNTKGIDASAKVFYG